MSDFESGDAVTGFNFADLEALGAQTIADISSFTPNLNIVTSGSTTPTFFIRGIGLNDFNANSTSAVAIYTDDVPIVSPALQLGTLFDVEAVNVLRGPQGTGPARHASGGAIKLYSRKPSGGYGGYLRASYGNYEHKEFEGAVEAPILEDILAVRIAGRWTQRDGTVTNNCGGLGSFQDRKDGIGANNQNSDGGPLFRPTGPGGSGTPDDPRWSACGEAVETRYFDLANKEKFGWIDGVGRVPPGLPTKVNDHNNWAARATFKFNPTLDMEFIVSGHGSRRNEDSRLGQSIGTSGTIDVADEQTGQILSSTQGYLGGSAGQGIARYTPREISAAQEAARISILQSRNCGSIDDNFAGCATGIRINARGESRRLVADDLAANLDSDPWSGDYNRVGDTINNTWGGYVKGSFALPLEIEMRTVTAWDAYDREIDIDLDFTPNILFEIFTDDKGRQFVQDVQLTGTLTEELPLRWDLGGFFLYERLDVTIQNDFGNRAGLGIGFRDYTQELWSGAGYASVAYDFWEKFTIDGGFRFNWDRKEIDYILTRGGASAGAPTVDFQSRDWYAPTGTVRLTYRFREDTYAFWKYTRGWKGGHYNATSSITEGVGVADPETIDAFEGGVRGAWFQGKLAFDIAFFYYEYDQYQLFTVKNEADGQPEFVVINASKVENYGADADLSLRPWTGFFANLRFGWLESQFLNFVQTQSQQQDPIIEDGRPVAGIIRRQIDSTGARLLNSPRFTISLTLEQSLRLGRFGEVVGRYDGAWTEKVFFDATEGTGFPNKDNELFLPDDTIAQPAYWLHNLRLTYRNPAGNVEVSGWVRNLTNEVYRNFAFDAATFNNITIHFVGDPRTYGADVSFIF